MNDTYPNTPCFPTALTKFDFQKNLKLNVKFVKDGKITKFVGKMIKKINNTIMQKFIIKISSK